jgi:hypothetical protein
LSFFAARGPGGGAVLHNSKVQTIICMKWGNRYPAAYVNCLWAMISRNTARPTRLVCYTDDAAGIGPEVTALPMLELPLPASHAWRPWRKVALWAPELPGVSSDDVLFLDLDIVITGSLDELFDYRPDSTFCVIENWTQMGSGIGNTSCYRFRVGAHSYIYDNVQNDPGGTVGAHANSQTYISRIIKEKTFWPAPWYKKIYKVVRPTPWIAEHWRPA